MIFFLSMLVLHIYIYTQIHIEYIQSVRVLLNKDCSNVLFQVLKKEFPRGVDIIYESVGGETFDVCLNALAVYGRLIVIGMISQVYFWILAGSVPCIHWFIICSEWWLQWVIQNKSKLSCAWPKKKIRILKVLRSWGADLHKVISDYTAGALEIVQFSSGAVNKHDFWSFGIELNFNFSLSLFSLLLSFLNSVGDGAYVLMLWAYTICS